MVQGQKLKYSNKEKLKTIMILILITLKYAYDNNNNIFNKNNKIFLVKYPKIAMDINSSDNSSIFMLFVTIIDATILFLVFTFFRSTISDKDAYYCPC